MIVHEQKRVDSGDKIKTCHRAVQTKDTYRSRSLGISADEADANGGKDGWRTAASSLPVLYATMLA